MDDNYLFHSVILFMFLCLREAYLLYKYDDARDDTSDIEQVIRKISDDCVVKNRDHEHSYRCSQ